MDACVIPKVFTKEQCESIISLHTNWPENKGEIGDNENARIDTDYRQCKVYEPPSSIPNSIPSWIIGRICKTIYAANKEAFNFDLGKRNVEGKSAYFELKLLKYDPGGHYDLHIDIGEGTTSSLRKISFTLLLNDSYEGGKLTFNIIPEMSQRNSEIGDMIIFPSYLEHKVEPVTSGVRWVLVGWILGNKHFR